MRIPGSLSRMSEKDNLEPNLVSNARNTTSVEVREGRLHMRINKEPINAQELIDNATLGLETPKLRVFCTLCHNLGEVWDVKTRRSIPCPKCRGGVK